MSAKRTLDAITSLFLANYFNDETPRKLRQKTIHVKNEIICHICLQECNNHWTYHNLNSNKVKVCNECKKMLKEKV